MDFNMEFLLTQATDWTIIISLTSWWARWRLKSPASRLFAEPFVQAQRKYESSASLAFVRGIHWWPMGSPHKEPVKRKMFSFDDVIMMVLLEQYVRLYMAWFMSSQAPAKWVTANSLPLEYYCWRCLEMRFLEHWCVHCNIIHLHRMVFKWFK